MTTYATTYGWRSTRVREDLMTSPPEQNPVNGAKGDQRGSMGPLTLSLRTEKVAGSSPAERAREIPAKRRYSRRPCGLCRVHGTLRADSSNDPLSMPLAKIRRGRMRIHAGLNGNPAPRRLPTFSPALRCSPQQAHNRSGSGPSGRSSPRASFTVSSPDARRRCSGSARTRWWCCSPTSGGSCYSPPCLDDAHNFRPSLPAAFLPSGRFLKADLR